MAGYVVWRALRTLNPGWNYFFSVPFWLCEFAGFVLSNAFMASLWNQINRPARRLEDMLSPEEIPHVDVYVPTYSGELGVLLSVFVCFENSHACMQGSACRVSLQESIASTS